ncbi:MAG: FliA/WhiG family RNA polymerase sigma factor [Candidatus Eisenbacteria bacterium]|uniref:FliA/WhiG family RNA polymerase sigma factor n=1 Tax=Eiseniibacteriota bacterium TaxID=2212470 RepID=A0A956N8D8_UNCEI|nr:FliA/WhiG family RNA polymerase sigma factor [Candidatus Eisenbacteria bacterium]
MVRSQTVRQTTAHEEEPVSVFYMRDKDAALKRYFPLVKYVVDKIATGLPKSIERDDLVNTAMIGLFDALEKYDESRGTKFETYAIWRIKGAVLDELRSMDWASRTTRRKARMIEQACQRLDQKLGRAATEQEMADELNLSLHEFLRLLEEVRGTVLLSLDQAMQVDDDHDLAGLADVIEDKAALNMLEELEDAEYRDKLLELINHLSEQERLVVALYYYEEMTLKEIGMALRISESRVSQIHTKAILRLKGRLHRALG